MLSVALYVVSSLLLIQLDFVGNSLLRICDSELEVFVTFVVQMRLRSSMIDVTPPVANNFCFEGMHLLFAVLLLLQYLLSLGVDVLLVI